MPDLATIPWYTLGPWGALTLVVLLVLRGDLVSRAVHQEVRDDRDAARAQIAQLIEAAAAQTTAIQGIQATTDAALHALEAIRAGGGDRGSNGPASGERG